MKKIHSPNCVLIDIWEKFLLICFHWKHLFKNINVFLVPLLFRGKACIVWNSNSWEFPVATKNATWRCFLRREQPIESSCRILGMPSLNKQTHSRKNNRKIQLIVCNWMQLPRGMRRICQYCRQTKFALELLSINVTKKICLK